jgi:hypothetical protein
MSRIFQDIWSDSYEANASLATRQFHFVKHAAGVAGGVQCRMALCGAGEQMMGVLQDTPNAAGIAGTVRHLGKTKLKVDGTTPITVGALLKSDSTGRGVVVTANNDKVGAIAEEAADAENQIITVMLVYFTHGA